MFRFDGKTVVITGAAAGIGEVAAQMFAENGAKVAVTDINLEAAEKAAERYVAKEGVHKHFCVT